MRNKSNFIVNELNFCVYLYLFEIRTVHKAYHIERKSINKLTRFGKIFIFVFNNFSFEFSILNN